MIWRDLRRLLRDIERASDRWRLVEATRGPGADQWRAIIDDGDTGRWHTLDAYTDLTVARPILPIGILPTAAGTVTPIGRPDGRLLRDGVRLAWGELLAVADGVAAHPSWRLVLLGRTRRDPARYQICALDRRGAAARPARWIDTQDDRARLRDGGRCLRAWGTIGGWAHAARPVTLRVADCPHSLLY